MATANGGTNIFTSAPRRLGSSGHGWPRGVVFDCDGLLIDSSYCWQQALRAVARAKDAELSDGQLAALTGASVATAADQLSRALGTDADEIELRAALDRAFAAFPAPALPGAERLLLMLHHQVSMAVATNGPLDLVDAALRRVALRGHFDTVVSAEEVANHKPAPDVYLEACRRLRVDPSEAVALEDSRVGLRAARAAGLFTIGVSTAGAPLDADLVVRRLDDPRVFDLLATTAFR